MNHSKNQSIPIWIIIYAGISALMLLYFTYGGYFDHSIQFSNLTETPGAAFPIGLYAVRDFAVAIGLITGIFLKDSRILLGMFIVRLITDLQDIYFIFWVDEAEGSKLVAGLVVGALIIASVVAIKVLWKHKNHPA